MNFNLTTAKAPKLNDLELDILLIDDIRFINLTALCQAIDLDQEYVEHVLQNTPVLQGCHMKTRDDLWLLQSFFASFLMHVAHQRIGNKFRVPFRELQNEAHVMISKEVQALHTILSYNATLTCTA